MNILSDVLIPFFAGALGALFVMYVDRSASK